MASKGLSGLNGTWENHKQGSENSIKAGDTPMKDGFMVNYDGPRDHVELLEYYFGHPSSTSKQHGAPRRSRW